MDALELALRCSNLLTRSMHRELRNESSLPQSVIGATTTGGMGENSGASSTDLTDATSGAGPVHVTIIGPTDRTPTDSGSKQRNISAPTEDIRPVSLCEPFDNGLGGTGGSVQFRSPSGHKRSASQSTSGQDDVSVGAANDLQLLSRPVPGPAVSADEAERHFSCDELGSGDEECSESDEGLPAALASDRITETTYEQSAPEEFGEFGDSAQTEEVADENKGIIWGLMKQVRPGMDLSKVVLPTFILEPRSFLEKFADYYYHSDLLKEAAAENDPYQRMKAVTKFYLSGFYKKPKGLKKPYNPILGETFRCYWQSNIDDSRTFFIGEQVSHHPPVSAFYVTNRKAGYTIAGTILPKSKFYGNSLSAVMNGSLHVCLLDRGETYTATLPYAYCKGLILGTLSMELGGAVTIHCDRTGYSAQLEFKLKPWLGGSDTMNVIAGKVKVGKETMGEIEGNWDATIKFHDKTNGSNEILWHPTAETIESRMKRFVVPIDKQKPTESERLWLQVTEALAAQDQFKATEEKTVLEEAQRRQAKLLKSQCKDHVPSFFEFEEATGRWLYKYADYRPWDPSNDVVQYEHDMIIQTRVRRKAPPVRSGSMMSGVDDSTVGTPTAGPSSTSGHHHYHHRHHHHKRKRSTASTAKDGMGGSSDEEDGSQDKSTPRESINQYNVGGCQAGKVSSIQVVGSTATSSPRRRSGASSSGHRTHLVSEKDAASPADMSALLNSIKTSVTETNNRVTSIQQRIDGVTSALPGRTVLRLGSTPHVSLSLQALGLIIAVFVAIQGALIMFYRKKFNAG